MLAFLRICSCLFRNKSIIANPCWIFHFGFKKLKFVRTTGLLLRSEYDAIRRPTRSSEQCRTWVITMNTIQTRGDINEYQKLDMFN